MIAAAPDSSSQLGVLDIVMRSVDANNPMRISDALKTHVLEILKTAARIADHSEAIGVGTPPEAIELALKIQSDLDLLQRIRQLQQFDGIEQTIAKRILKSLTPLAA
jgi:hypothetical protein